LASNVNIKFLHTEHLVKVELIELKLNFFAMVSVLVKVHKTNTDEASPIKKENLVFKVHCLTQKCRLPRDVTVKN
jgi:hypothetical protein